MARLLNIASEAPRRSQTRPLAILLATAATLALALLLPPPSGLTRAGWTTLVLVLSAVVLWSTEALPTGATALTTVLLLAATGATPGLQAALSGFARPTVFFLLGVLALGAATLQSGLARRAAELFLAGAQGRGGLLYSQMVAGFAGLALVLPSASTRGAILLPVYEHALDLLEVQPRGPLRRAIMVGLASLNRLGSNALLTGGITPVVAAGLIGGFTWTSWLVYMGVPVYILLALGGVAVFLMHRPDQETLLRGNWTLRRERLTGREWRTLIILVVVSGLWMTDAIHHLDPAVPALIGTVAIVAPRFGVISWRDLEGGVGWANLLVIAASFSLAQAMASSGAAGWLADVLRVGAQSAAGQPLVLAAELIIVCLLLRAVLPNIAAYLTLLIPVTLQLAPDLGLNPVVCAMLVTVAGDSVLYYPAQSSSSLMVAERGQVFAPDVARLAAVMAPLVVLVLLLVAVPYWSWLGQPLAVP